jgi:hypothetical protein
LDAILFPGSGSIKNYFQRNISANEAPEGVGGSGGTGAGTGVSNRVGPFSSREGISMSMDLTLASPSPSPSVCAAPIPVPVAVPSHQNLNLEANTCGPSSTPRERRDRERDIGPFRAIEGTDCLSGRDGPFSSATSHTAATVAPAAVNSMPFSSDHNKNPASDIKSRNKSPKKVSKFFSKISINVRICCTELH